MIREGFLFKIALFISAAAHIGGFGLFWRGENSYLKNGLGSSKNKIIVFEIGWVSQAVQKQQPAGAIEGSREVPGGRLALPAVPLPPANSGQMGSSGRAKENLGAIENEYLLEIRRRIEQSKFYPKEAKKRLITGSVTICFYIDNNGSPKDISIIKSSGSYILDNTSKEIVLRAGPFPKPLNGGNNQNVQTTIVFSLSAHTASAM